MNLLSQLRRVVAALGWALFFAAGLYATPANRAALEKHYDRFLKPALARCVTCHQPSDLKAPESLEEFPHNAFGHRLKVLGDELRAAGQERTLELRLARIATEDADGDGVSNETELLLGHQPGNAQDLPTADQLQTATERQTEFAQFLASYRWKPFESVVRPPLPTPAIPGFQARNPIDAFLAAEWSARGLRPRPEASREVLLRRVYQDLIGLNPTPEEQRAFLTNAAPDAYEQVVDRLLQDPRHGERWARHWMDVWRYSDWAGWADGNQIRDSKPHIWRWRDWIVESLNTDRPYDRMVTEMLAADELAPEDPDALRATGFLVRNYKMLSREQWLEDTVKHTSQAFFGVTMGCAKCHDHMFDPISQREYFELRAIFEPHQVRTDRRPGQLDTARDGVVRTYDSTNAPTWFLVRGDERHPLTNEVIPPGVPRVLGGRLEVQEVQLPWSAAQPDLRDFVRQDVWTASDQKLQQARLEWVKASTNDTLTAPARRDVELRLDVAEKQHAALEALLLTEPTSRGPRLADPIAAQRHATNTALLQLTANVAEARWRQLQAESALAQATNQVEETRKKLTEANQQLAKATAALAEPLHARFQPRPTESFPATSTGRRLAFARWIVRPDHPLTARVAVNHVWLRHFGRGLVGSPADFGRNGRPPTNPQLLDWLAAEFMSPSVRASEKPWSFRHLHRLMVTSAAYRMSSTPEDANLAADPDNRFLWRMNSRRLEAEAVRDNVLYASGSLDLTRGGPDLDHAQALTTPRRSIYFRHAAEKQAEFLQIFDGAGVTECYERHPSIMPQQALALGNSELVTRQAAVLAARLTAEAGDDDQRWVELAFERILARKPTRQEQQQCQEFLSLRSVSSGSTPPRQRAFENLVLVLFNHNDFVTIR